MLGWAFMFLVLAILAGVLGFTGVAALSVDIAWVLVIAFLILAAVSAIMGRRPRLE